MTLSELRPLRLLATDTIATTFGGGKTWYLVKLSLPTEALGFQHVQYSLVKSPVII
jgi:hypothetical protein